MEPDVDEFKVSLPTLVWVNAGSTRRNLRFNPFPPEAIVHRREGEPAFRKGKMAAAPE